jgi:enoyl-CoA hydratase/carnithine racemase
VVIVDLTVRDVSAASVAAPRLAVVPDAPTEYDRTTSMVLPRGRPAPVVTPDDPEWFDARELRARTDLGTLPAVIIGIGPLDHPDAELVDVVAADTDEADRIADAVAATPIASSALALLLRHGDDRSIGAGLVAESATYSMLQAGPEFAAWRAARAAKPPRPNAPGAPAVVVERSSTHTTIRLNRPHVHNAVNTELAELLVAALTDTLNDADASPRGGGPPAWTILTGAGPSFCSGGDLAEFGSFQSPADAHGVRLLRSAGQLISMLGYRARTMLHGAAMGAGIELPAFGDLILAQSSTRIALPEIRLGLVPGAGGTVSLPRRIGRHRTAQLALTGDQIDAYTALEWGLVDEVLDDMDDEHDEQHWPPSSRRDARTATDPER